MLLYFVNKFLKKSNNFSKIYNPETKKKIKKKEKLSPIIKAQYKQRTKAFFFAPLSGSLTVEAAMVLPIFVFAMVTLLQIGRAMECAVKMDSALCEISEGMAVAAYAEDDMEILQKVPELAKVAAGEVLAQSLIMNKAGDIQAINLVNMVQSSLVGKEQYIDLILSYRVKPPGKMFGISRIFIVNRARVRAWTGREGVRKITDDAEETAETETEEQIVYIAQTGSVYHISPDCSYLRLSTKSVSASSIEQQRNRGGAKYYPCELCGEKNPSGIVYITNDGIRYHSSLSCSGLKRSVSAVPLSEADGRHVCSRCG